MEISEELSGELFKRYGKELKKGDVLFHEDDEADAVYVVISGKINISKQIKSGKYKYERIISSVSSGGILGEIALLMPNSKRSASAYVSEDSKIIVIDRSTFYAMIRYNAEFSLKLMERLSGYVIRANKDLEEISFGQKKLLVIDELIILSNKNKTDILKKKDIIESESLLEQMNTDIIEKILSQLVMLKAISLEEDNVKILSFDLLNKFKLLLVDTIAVNTTKPDGTN